MVQQCNTGDLEGNKKGRLEIFRKIRKSGVMIQVLVWNAPNIKIINPAWTIDTVSLLVIIEYPLLLYCR